MDDTPIGVLIVTGGNCACARRAPHHAVASRLAIASREGWLAKADDCGRLLNFGFDFCKSRLVHLLIQRRKIGFE
jgi:hypothetical protein